MKVQISTIKQESSKFKPYFEAKDQVVNSKSQGFIKSRNDGLRVGTLS